MASKTKQREASRTISDALALSHFITANVLVLVGEFTELFSFVGGKHPGMDFVKTYLDAPAVYLLDIYWAFSSGFAFLSVFFEGAKHGDTSAFAVWLAIESVILMASFLYWVLCYLATRLIISMTQ